MPRPGRGSGGEAGQQLYNDFGGSELDGVNFQSMPADESHDAGYGLWGLYAARAAHKKTQANGQEADSENEDSERNRRKREFNLFLPDVGDRCDDAGEQTH